MAVDTSLDHIIQFFLPEARLEKAVPSTAGNINQTWIVHLTKAGSARPAVLQRLSPAVFPDLPAVMRNFQRITRHLAEQPGPGRDKQASAPINAKPPMFPQAYTNPEGQDWLTDTDGGLWRLITYIGPSRTLDKVNARQAAAVGAMLSRFHQLISTIPAAELHDPLPGFHDTPQYLRHFESVSAGHSPKNSEEEFCFASIEALRPLASLLEGNAGSHARQVVHADPKCSNFLFAEHSDAVLSLIDLDTVRFGYLLHDLGDCLRSCCNQGGEEQNMQPHFDPHCFRALLAAYLGSGGKSLLTSADQAHLLDAARLLIFELGLRFFTDYLQGSPYFTCRYPKHNLHRAVVQFRLHASLMAQDDQLRQELATLLA